MKGWNFKADGTPYKTAEDGGPLSGWRFKGPPPEDHPNRCIGISRMTGERCRCWATVGLKRCRFHGGVHKKAKAKSSRRFSSQFIRCDENESGNEATLRYARHLGTTLKARVQELAGPENPVNDLTDEITLVRGLACDALALYAKCEALPEGDKKTHALIQAGMMVREVVGEVASLVMSKSRVENANQQKVDVTAINLLVMQMTKIISHAVGNFCDAHELDSAELMRQITFGIDQDLRLPTGQDGTTLLPDEDVLEMDESVPRVIARDTPPHESNGHAGGSKNGAA